MFKEAFCHLIFKVNGDTVTLCLEVKSTRERATPDKAVWGFSVIIAANQVQSFCK